MVPSELEDFLDKVINSSLNKSIMIWGAPGIGKSSIVQSLAIKLNLQFIDLRLSQLAPTDLRGLPVPIHSSNESEGTVKWYKPEFLPQSGKGILFLDEINMAPPAMQGVAQQLILDRKIGNYKVPEGWFVFAAGNRKEDKASVFDMPAPLSNRFLHLFVETNFDCFKAYSFEKNICEEIISFLSFRPNLLHKFSDHEMAWPSPRTWELASDLYKINLPIKSAVGESVALEFESYLEVYGKIPDLKLIIEGKAKSIKFPDEISCKWATLTGLITRCNKPNEVLIVFNWLFGNAGEEWIQLFVSDIVDKFEKKRQLANLSKILVKEKAIQKYMIKKNELLKK